MSRRGFIKLLGLSSAAVASGVAVVARKINPLFANGDIVMEYVSPQCFEGEWELGSKIEFLDAPVELNIRTSMTKRVYQWDDGSSCDGPTFSLDG